MKFINRIINSLKSFWQRVKYFFTSKKEKQFAKEALIAREQHKAKVLKNKSYFDRLPRKKGFKKAPSFSHMVSSKTNALLEKEHRRRLLEARGGKPKPKKRKTKEQHEAQELSEAKRTFFINLIGERAKKIQAPFIAEKRKKKLSFINQGKKVATPFEEKKPKKQKPLHIASGQAGNQHKANLKYHV